MNNDNPVITTPPQDKIKEGVAKGYFRFLNEGTKIEYLPQGHKENYNDPEEHVRAEYYFDLLEKYHYPSQRIDFEVEMPDRTPERYADIVIYEDDAKKHPYIVVECKKDGISDAEYEQATKQAIANSRVLRSPYAMCVAGNTQRAMETDAWNDREPEKATITDIPISYGKIEEFRYKKGDPNWDVKTVDQNELKRAFQKCHDTLWAGGKRSPTTAFDEFAKIIFVKIRDEKKGRRVGDPYDFQIKTHEPAESVYERINGIYLEAKNRDPEIFKESLKIEPEELYTVVEHLQGISLNKTDLDTKGVAFEQFMEDFFKGKNGQFFTPRIIVNFAIQMMDIKNEHKVLDPACGSGGFLLHALDHVRKQAEEYYPDDLSEQYRYWHDFAANNLFGIEINDSIARVAKMNMIIHDDGHTNVIGFDALDNIDKMNEKNRGFSKEGFDVLVTNPPFGATVKQTEHPYLSTYSLGKNGSKVRNNQKTEVLFIERCLDFLKSGTGHMAIVLPDGILTNYSLQYVREHLMEKVQILAVISLPLFAFAHFGAGVKSSLIFIRKKAKGENVSDYSIFMALAEHIGYDATGRTDEKNDLPEIMKRYRSGEWEFKNSPTSFSFQKEKLEGRLDPSYYQPHFIEAYKQVTTLKCKSYPFGSIMSDMSGGATPKVEGDYYTDEGDGVPFLRVQNISPEGLVLDDVKYIKQIVHNTSLKRSQLRKDDLVFTITGRIGSVAIIPEGFAGNINQHSVRIHLKDSIDGKKIYPLYVVCFLNSRLGQLITNRGITGGTRPALDYQYIKSIPIPIPSPEVQEKIINAEKARLADIKRLEEELASNKVKSKMGIEKIMTEM